MRPPGPRASLCALPLLALNACASLATSPDWVGGGMSVSAPLRIAQEDAAEEREREAIAKQPAEIGAKHILVMHDSSKAKPEGVNRSREDARRRAHEALVKIRGGESFEKVVVAYSDEPGSEQRGGDLGVFDRSVMVKSFADVAFALKVGEISEVIETPFGFHIIKRTE